MLATSVLDVLEVIVLGALGFLVVAVVCVVVLAFLQLILPKTDAGAEAVARRQGGAPAGDEAEIQGPEALDSEDDA